ncbi:MULTISPECIES: hypothetical protein [unclassified Endozoicomonas]|nr:MULTISPECIES: hypothetical protein [unclassified Endozoicomonas]
MILPLHSGVQGGRIDQENNASSKSADTPIAVVLPKDDKSSLVGKVL